MRRCPLTLNKNDAKSLPLLPEPAPLDKKCGGNFSENRPLPIFIHKQLRTLLSRYKFYSITSVGFVQIGKIRC